MEYQINSTNDQCHKTLQSGARYPAWLNCERGVRSVICSTHLISISRKLTGIFLSDSATLCWMTNKMWRRKTLNNRQNNISQEIGLHIQPSFDCLIFSTKIIHILLLQLVAFKFLLLDLIHYIIARLLWVEYDSAGWGEWECGDGVNIWSVIVSLYHIHGITMTTIERAADPCIAQPQTQESWQLGRSKGWRILIRVFLQT